MPHHHIKISIALDSQGNANFTYSPSVQRVYAGDTVDWSSPNGPFAILFQEGTPCNRMDARSDANVPWMSTQLSVLTNAAPGHYHYAAAVSMQGIVYVDGACPELIVN